MTTTYALTATAVANQIHLRFLDTEHRQPCWDQQQHRISGGRDQTTGTRSISHDFAHPSNPLRPPLSPKPWGWRSVIPLGLRPTRRPVSIRGCLPQSVPEDLIRKFVVVAIPEARWILTDTYWVAVRVIRTEKPLMHVSAGSFQ